MRATPQVPRPPAKASGPGRGEAGPVRRRMPEPSADRHAIQKPGGGSLGLVVSTVILESRRQLRADRGETKPWLAMETGDRKQADGRANIRAPPSLREGADGSTQHAPHGRQKWLGFTGA